ncbi:MAG: hypothetical protein AAFO83_13500 [Cyanobacteria bacterium J06607_13]
MTALFAFCVFVVVLVGNPFTLLVPATTGQGAVIAQPTPIRRINPGAIAAALYPQLPFLPLENQYISSETGTAVTEDTLLSRLIRYHIYIKQRPSVFRLDWKLTLADYLGAFERIDPSSYPDYGLRENPRDNDIAAIANLSIQQRVQLVNTLYEAFTTPADSPTTPAADSTGPAT